MRSQPALVKVEPAVQIPADRTPEPDPALFLAFVDLQPTQESILAFASARGNLAEAWKLVSVHRPGAAGGEPVRGVPLSLWKYQIDDMARCVALWDALRQEDYERLNHHIRWTKEGKQGPAVYFVSHPKGGPSLGARKVKEVIASAEDQAERFAQFEVGDPILPGWTYLQQEVEIHLQPVAFEVAAGMAWDAERRRPGLELTAWTMLSAIWLQLADAVANEKTFSRCAECRRWFEVGPEGAPSHRRYCSSSCRTRALRERQDRARRLYTIHKMSFEAIAEELDSDVGTVKRWITGVKE
jgi:hypothetical protein